MSCPVPINDLVPREVRAERYDEYCWVRRAMERNLSSPIKIHRYATHESGHLLYMERTGLISSPEDAIFERPTIYFDPVDGFKFFMAAVGCSHGTYSLECLNKLAQAGVAAGVIEITLLRAGEDTHTAIREDELKFQWRCYDAFWDNGISVEYYRLWEAARERVKQDVAESSDLESRIDRLRPLVLQRCFGLSSSHDFNTLSHDPV
jgi:hypothetical protein